MDSALDLPNSTVTSFFDFDEALEGIGTENDWFGNNDTELNCTDHEMESTDINFVFHGVGISFLALFGIPANVLSVIVLKHPRMKSSLTTLLVGLTISDMFVISTSSLIFSFPAIFEYVKIFQWYTAIFHPAKKQRCVRRNSLSPSMAHTSSSNSEDLALAGMLFGIVITFFACNMLSLVINVMESFGAEGFESLIPISNFLIVFGCSTNFVFYCVFGKKFRSHLTQTLGISKKSMKGGSGGSDNSTDNFRMTYNNSRNKAPAFIKTKWNSVNSAISNISSSVEHQPTNYYDYDSKPNRIIEEAATAEDQDTNKNNVGEVSCSQVTVHTILSD
ncbi:unnamed protein product [Orchesella dallaii]|uniref:G-protein coupled receptors family 1 profile domain-containing protein n=1 Tax=Orchesella dallaii TaxID=48710 RepID=A0ABP1S5E6_9HEXA